MSNERFIPNNATHDFVSFSILLDGKEMKNVYSVFSIWVNKEANRIPTAKIEIRDGDAALEGFEISNTKDFIPGKEIEIQAGYDGNNETVFKGIIVKHGIKISGNGVAVLKIDCQDKAVKMTVGRKNKYFEKLKDSEIIEKLIGTYSLGKEVDTTKLKHKELVQYHVTDWDFMMMRAEVNGLVVLVDDGKVKVKAPDTSSTPALTLGYGSTLIEFEAEMDSRQQWKKVTVSSWDYATQKLEKKDSSTAPKFKGTGNITGEKMSDVLGLNEFELRHSGKLDPLELTTWADATMLKSRIAKICGRAKCFGFAKIKPGDVLELEGVGDRFNGKVYVTGVSQELVDGTWFTHIQFGLPNEWFYQKPNVMDSPGSGMIPAVHGLQIGKVVKLEKDPDGEDRIQVRIPIIDDQAKGVWARRATLDAGKDRGSFFLPEIDDEVVIGYVNDDPGDAIILGMLHSSKLPAPAPASDENHEKGFKTRSGMRVWFDDDKKIITIETVEGNNSIVLSEDGKSIILTDQNKNTITMDDKGIALNSPKDIVLEAKGKIEIKATQDLKMEGLNVSAKAKAEFKAEGSAGAKLTTSAIAEIKGSLVKIN